MGYMLNNIIQDVLVRKVCMEGKNVCWVLGIDYVFIVMEVKVVQKFCVEGIKKFDLFCEEFLCYVFDWKEKYGGVILQQFKKFGVLCDWECIVFIMDLVYLELVIGVFIDLFKKGKIYCGVCMINWDLEVLIVVFDEEVIYKEVNFKFFYVCYKIVGMEDEWMIIVIICFEMIFGDFVICVNLNDLCYQYLYGKFVVVLVVNCIVLIIVDEYVEMDFGIGCLKVILVYDINDYEFGKKYDFEIIDIFNVNGILNEYGFYYVGKDCFEVWKEIVCEFDDKGYFVKIEDYVNKVGFFECMDSVIELCLLL